MLYKALSIAAVLALGTIAPVGAQSFASPASSPAASEGVVAIVDVSRLPIDLRRIERNFRRTTIREERDGLNLRYFVDVFAKAPPIVIITPQDNVLYGPASYGAPTHREMVQMMTPPEFRASGMMLGSGLGVPRKKTSGR